MLQAILSCVFLCTVPVLARDGLSPQNQYVHFRRIFGTTPLTPRIRGGEQKQIKDWRDDLPPMPSEPPPPPPDLPSEIMGGTGKTATGLPGSPNTSGGLQKKMSWRGLRTKSEVAEDDHSTEEDYGFKTLRKPKPISTDNSSSSSGISRPKWSAVIEQKDTSTIASTNRPVSPPQKVIAGGISAVLSQCLLYPVDALRTLAQTRDHLTLASVGAKALIRGSVQTSSLALISSALQFGILAGTTRSNICGPVVASALTAAGLCISIVPQEVIKQRLVTGVHSGFRNACTTIYKGKGIKGFYNSWIPTTLARNVPFAIATYTANDFMTQKILQRKQAKQGKNWVGEAGTINSASTQLSTVENFFVSVTSIIAGAVLTQPADVVKTRMMTQSASHQVPYLSAANCVLTMLKSEGITPFYSGFLQRSFYMASLFSLQFAINKMCLNSLEQRNTAKD